MEMWDSVPAKNFTVPFIHLQIGLENDVLNNLIYFIDYDEEKLSTAEEVVQYALDRLLYITNCRCCLRSDYIRCTILSDIYPLI